MCVGGDCTFDMDDSGFVCVGGEIEPSMCVCVGGEPSCGVPGAVTSVDDAKRSTCKIDLSDIYSCAVVVVVSIIVFGLLCKSV